MFIEVTSATTDNKLLINVNTIDVIRPKGDKSELEVGKGIYYEVQESYDQIKKLIVSSRARLQA